tara:strand:- start:34 stop:450 length:417 start_codon:yes stop_codon:yes gene_type:complete
MSSFESLKNIFDEFISFNEEKISNKLHINISNFDINKFKKKEKLLTEYILFIIFKIKEKSPKNTDVYVYMKGVKKSHFYPLYLSKVLKPLSGILKGENSPDLLRNVYIYDLGKIGLIIWNVVKHLFHKDTIKKITIMN